VLKRTLQTTLLLAVACAPAAAATPQAHTAAVRAAETSLEETEQLLDGRGVQTGRELTDSLRELSTRIRHLRGDERERAIALLSRPTDEDAPFDERYTVPELPPLCDANFCIHSVGSGVDAPSSGMAALVLSEANAIRDFENGTLGWREAPDDGDGRVDIYLKELGVSRLFGFAATDPGQNQQSQHSYLVLDQDFDPAQYGGAPAIESLRVTMAHEYAHVLQYGYDVLADGWHYESSAVWMEQQIFPEITDWLRFMRDSPTGPGWRSLTELSLTYFEPNPEGPGAPDPRTAKPYGDVVWNRFLSAKYGAAGNALQRATWERSFGIQRPSTSAFHGAIRAAGGSGLADDFDEFSAAVAEWRVARAPFFTPAQLPDVERRGTIARGGAAVRAVMDHLSFALYDVPPVSSGPLRLAASFPEGTAAAVALVARSGSIDGGQVTTELRHLRNGGLGGVTIDNPARFYASGGRITAVLVNSDSSHGDWNEQVGDWHWLRDDQRATARASSDVRRPRASLRGFQLRSRDPDRLTFTATLRQRGQIVGRRSGSIRPGAKRRLRIAGTRPGRARLLVRLTDPAANTRRLARSLRLAR
jgi:hypothetical protein